MQTDVKFYIARKKKALDLSFCITNINPEMIVFQGFSF